MSKNKFLPFIDLSFWFAVIVFGIILNLIVVYGPVILDNFFGKNALEKCADQRYGPGLSILGDDLKKKVKSSHYHDLYQSCEREQKTTPSTFKLKYGK